MTLALVPGEISGLLLRTAEGASSWDPPSALVLESLQCHQPPSPTSVSSRDWALVHVDTHMLSLTQAHIHTHTNAGNPSWS